MINFVSISLAGSGQNYNGIIKCARVCVQTENKGEAGNFCPAA